MPFVHLFDLKDESSPAERNVAGKGFHYEDLIFGDPSFVPGDLREEKDAGPALGWLRELGTTAVRVQYDGGCDEGFAYLACAETPESTLSIDDLVARWSTEGKAESLPTPPPQSSWSDEERLRWAADEFANALATRFLGLGYGTGEYQMFGEFTADLRTGQFVDLRDAEPRDGAIQPDDPDPEEAAERAEMRPEEERLRREPPPPLVRLWRRLFGREE